jgi:hypothetical protein
MVDRKAVFTGAFREFLDTQRRVVCEERTQRRYVGEGDEKKWSVTEWREVEENTYKEEVLPQTLSEEDIKNDRWPAAIYIFTLEDGRKLRSFVQESRDFGAQNLRVDFMGIELLGKEPKKIEELCWGRSDINQYLPNVTGAQGRSRGRIVGLEVDEPEPVSQA